MTALAASRMVCHECDLVVDVPVLEVNDRAYCPRCSYLLASNRPNAFAKMFAYSVAALIFLVLANAFPFLSLNAGGHEQSVTLPGSVAVLFNEDHVLLSAIVFATIIGVPAVLLLGIVYVSIAIRLPQGLPGMRRMLRWSLNLIPWSMAEIFLIGILVSFIKIVSLADVALGLSFWAYVSFTVFLVLVLINIDRREVWRRVQAVRGG